MMSNDRDEAFYMDEGEPPIKGCLLHSDQAAVQRFTAEARAGFGGVVYGLCLGCVKMLPSEKMNEWIESEINHRLKNLIKENDNGNN